MVPNSATATSSITDIVYAGTAMRIIICGVMLAATHITKKHSRMLRKWSSILPGMPMLAEYRVSRLVHSSIRMMIISGGSNTAR